jgi:hypothetical protein
MREVDKHAGRARSPSTGAHLLHLRNHAVGQHRTLGQDHSRCALRLAATADVEPLAWRHGGGVAAMPGGSEELPGVSAMRYSNGGLGAARRALRQCSGLARNAGQGVGGDPIQDGNVATGKLMRTAPADPLLLSLPHHRRLRGRKRDADQHWPRSCTLHLYVAISNVAPRSHLPSAAAMSDVVGRGIV